MPARRGTLRAWIARVIADPEAMMGTALAFRDLPRERRAEWMVALREESAALDVDVEPVFAVLQGVETHGVVQRAIIGDDALRLALQHDGTALPASLRAFRTPTELVFCWRALAPTKLALVDAESRVFAVTEVRLAVSQQLLTAADARTWLAVAACIPHAANETPITVLPACDLNDAIDEAALLIWRWRRAAHQALPALDLLAPLFGVLPPAHGSAARDLATLAQAVR